MQAATSQLGTSPALSFSYNGLDDRVSEGATVKRFAYDSMGRIVGEYGAGPSAVRGEYISLLADAANDNASPHGGDDGVGGYALLTIMTPDAADGGAITAQYPHSNHLGAPMFSTDASGAVVTPGDHAQPVSAIPMYLAQTRTYTTRIFAPPVSLRVDAGGFAAQGNAMTELRLFNSLTRKLEPFQPVHEGEARVYSCGPTVYNYQHIGNMRAYVFADTLGRVLTYKGYKLTHVINITDVGHLTSDADAGDDKMEKAAAAQGKTAWDIAAFYQADFEADLARLNIRKPAHPKATDYVEAMIEWGKEIADKHCYALESGLYFDVSTVPEYGRLARAVTEDGEGRIEDVGGKRNKADFAIWRKTPAGETRQMEWDSPWGMGAPGWHLECSVMSKALLGMPFDIHTGGIDHREIHHPNEIAQNQAHEGCADTGARIWMHNNFLVERSGKMSKSSGEFLRLQLLIDKGFHPLAYRLMCLQAHYRSELEFSWEGLQAAFVRLKRMVMGVEKFSSTLNEICADPFVFNPEFERSLEFIANFDSSILADLNTAEALTFFERTITEKTLAGKRVEPEERLLAIANMDFVFGLNLLSITRQDLRIRPKAAIITEAEIEAALAARKEARAAKDFATSDRIRDDLIAKGVEVMDGDPLGWDWKLDV